MKLVLCLAVMVASTAWADEATDRAAIEATVAALNTSPAASDLFTPGFANANELQRFFERSRSDIVETQAGTLVISAEPLGEVTLHIPAVAIPPARFVTQSVTFISSDISVVIAVHERQAGPVDSRCAPVLFVLRHEGPDWRIASFRELPEAAIKRVP